MRLITALTLAWRALRHNSLRTLLTTSTIAAAVSAIHIHQTFTLRPAQRTAEVVDRFESRYVLAYDSLGTTFETAPLDRLESELKQAGMARRHDFLCGYFLSEDDPIPVLLCSLPPVEPPEWESLYAVSAGRKPRAGAREALVDEAFAARWNLKIGDPLEIYRKRPPLTVVGLFTRAAQLPTAEVYAPLADVQLLRDRAGSAGMSLLQVAPEATPEQVAARLAPLLPDLQVKPAAWAAQRLRAGIRPIELASGALAAVVGVLCGVIGLLALLAAVHERRRDFATLRALGIARRAVFGQVLMEGVGLGLYGTLKGLLIGEGLLLVFGPRLHPVFSGASQWQELLVPAAVGLAVTALGALLPAWHASRASPQELMQA